MRDALPTESWGTGGSVDQQQAHCVPQADRVSSATQMASRPVDAPARDTAQKSQDARCRLSGFTAGHGTEADCFQVWKVVAHATNSIL